MPEGCCCGKIDGTGPGRVNPHRQSIELLIRVVNSEGSTRLVDLSDKRGRSTEQVDFDQKDEPEIDGVVDSSWLTNERKAETTASETFALWIDETGQS